MSHILYVFVPYIHVSNRDNIKDNFWDLFYEHRLYSVILNHHLLKGLSSPQHCCIHALALASTGLS